MNQKRDTQKMSDRALLLDMDGVVLDSMRYHVAAWLKALGEMGFSVKEELLYLYEGAIEPDIAARLFSSQGCIMDQQRFQAVLKRQKEIFVSEYKRLVRPFPEIPDVISTIKSNGLRLALVTSSHKEILEAVLPANLVRLFDSVVTGDQVTRRKPHPDPYLKALQTTGLDGKQAIAVENAPSGIKSAKSAGLRTIAITTTLPPHRLREADIVIYRHRQLLDMI